jgi:para-nitrobenzyl esterase
VSGSVVETTYGRVSGSVRSDVQVFRGVPYGASTEGGGRFRPPSPPQAWTGVREATTFGAKAPQPPGIESTLISDEFRSAAGGMTTTDAVGEDCLVLNVYASALDDGRRPVMVWLHGGGHTMGSAAQYNGSRLAARGDVVVVTINHRLGMMAYLYLDEVVPDRFAGSGNVGMLDIVAALEWVRANIAAFGGDPENVTIFGESGGGSKVSTLLAMPPARGLFHRAIVQSGPGLRGIEPAAATAAAEEVLATLGIAPNKVDALLELPLDRLLEVQSVVGASAGGSGPVGGRRAYPFAPVVDGGALPQHPFDPAASPLAAEVPLIIGTNKDEATTFLLMRPNFESTTQPEIEELATSMFGDGARDVLDLYARTQPDETPVELLVSLSMTDAIWLDSIHLAERKGAGGPAPVFMYQFAYETDVLNGKLKAAHGLEVPFVFGDVAAAPLTGSNPGRFELAQLMSEAWVTFAKTGDPNHAGLPKWSPYSPDDRATMIFDTPCRVDVDPRTELRKGLDSLAIPLR